MKIVPTVLGMDGQEMLHRLLAVIDGAVAGHLDYRTTRGDDRAYVVHVEVDGDKRRRGIASALYDALAATLPGPDHIRTIGGRTPDGTAFRAVWDLRSGAAAKLRELEAVRQAVFAARARFDEAMENGLDPLTGAAVPPDRLERWDVLNDLSWELEKLCHAAAVGEDIALADLPDDVRAVVQKAMQTPDAVTAEAPASVEASALAR